MKNQPVPSVLREDVIRIVQRDFPNTNEEQVLTILDVYGTAAWQRERDRVQLAVLKLAAGDLASLKRHIGMACKDYRDVLAYAEYPADFKREPGALRSNSERAETFSTDWNQYREWFMRS